MFNLIYLLTFFLSLQSKFFDQKKMPRKVQPMLFLALALLLTTQINASQIANDENCPSPSIYVAPNVCVCNGHHFKMTLGTDDNGNYFQHCQNLRAMNGNAMVATITALAVMVVSITLCGQGSKVCCPLPDQD